MSTMMKRVVRRRLAFGCAIAPTVEESVLVINHARPSDRNSLTLLASASQRAMMTLRMEEPV